MNLTRRLTEGVGAWLQFETHCNRRGLFSERYLSGPVGQILGAVYGPNVHAEARHQDLAALQTGPGKKARVDFIARNSNNDIVAAVESKWIGATKPSVDQIAWDLLRLELLASNQGVECCFLLGGRKQDIDRYLKRDDFLGKGPGDRKPLLPVNPGSLTYYKLRAAPPNRWSMYRRILHDWQDLPVAERFGISLNEAFPDKCKNDQYQVYGWTVRSATPRVTFMPKDSKNYRAVRSVHTAEEGAT